MSALFTRTQAIALTWTTDACHAIRVTVQGRGARVAAHWHGQVGKECTSLAELLMRAVKEVGGDDQSYIVAGGNGQGWGMADLVMPPLKREEMQNALAFQLRKQTPLPADRLRWGYRLLPRKKGDATQKVRLFYVRSENWNSWLKAMDGLHHVDALIPAAVALDPLLENATLTLPEEPPATGQYRYEPSPEGRQVSPVAEECAKPFAELLPRDLCEPGELEKLSPQEQSFYVAPALLALYGLTASLNDDQSTLVPLPERFHARRFLSAKIGVAVLALYLVLLMVYFLAGSFSGYALQLRQVDQAIKKTTAELDALKKAADPKDKERVTLIRQELQDNTPNSPDFPTALLAVTRTVPSTHWLADPLEWRDSKLSFRVQGPQKDAELSLRLEESPYLGDAAERLSTTTKEGSITQRFEVTARYDTPLEAQIRQAKEEAKLEQEKAQKEQEKALRQAQKKADAEEEPDLEDDDAELEFIEEEE